jgi:hypothetical protein
VGVYRGVFKEKYSVEVGELKTGLFLWSSPAFMKVFSRDMKCPIFLLS